MAEEQHDTIDDLSTELRRFPPPEGFAENIDGVMMNLTVTDTLGFGFLTVFSADITATPNVSSINWFANGMSVANHVVSAVDLAQLKVACGGGGSTHFIVDVIGVYG